MIYLLDSNAIIDYLSAAMPSSAMVKMNSIIDDGLFISLISKIEVLGFHSDTPSINDNNERFIGIARVFELSSEIVDQTISIRKKLKIKLPDAIVAATALVHNLTLITRNTTDFKKYRELQL
jgi:predicted nucleic acid-binding protein